MIHPMIILDGHDLFQSDESESEDEVDVDQDECMICFFGAL